MVKSLCKVQCSPQGVTQSVAAHWLHSRKEGRFPNLIVVRTTEFSVYCVKIHATDDKASLDADDQEAKRPASHTLELEYSTHLHGEVLAMACLPARRHTFRDSIILMFESVRRPRMLAMRAACLCNANQAVTAQHHVYVHCLCCAGPSSSDGMGRYQDGTSSYKPAYV